MDPALRLPPTPGRAALDLGWGVRCAGCGSPGRLWCPECSDSLPDRARPSRPTPCPEGLAPGFAVADYAGPVRGLILAHKERGAFSLARPLGELLALAVAAAVAEARSPPAEGATVLLIPVPSRRPVVRRRGHDPMLRVARRAAIALRRTGWDARTRSVLTVGIVADQAGLDTAARARNLNGAMSVRPAALKSLARSGRALWAVVCDDVVTTGATAREAQRALEAVGIPVVGIACVAATVRTGAHPRPAGIDSSARASGS